MNAPTQHEDEPQAPAGAEPEAEAHDDHGESERDNDDIVESDMDEFRDERRYEDDDLR